MNEKFFIRTQSNFAGMYGVGEVVSPGVALFRTGEFSEVEMGVIRAFDWDRINYSDPAKRAKYCRMVGISADELDQMRTHSKMVFQKYYPDYKGPFSFKEMAAMSKEEFENARPLIPA